MLEIADKAGKLYDKFVGFLQDMDKMGKSLDQAHRAYESGMNKLETGNGNLIRRVEDLKKLGAKAQKQIPEQHFREDQDPPEALGQSS